MPAMIGDAKEVPPAPDHAARLCCVACTVGASPAVPVEAPSAILADQGHILQLPTGHAAAVPPPRRAVRDGPSQGPPSLA